MALPDDVTAVHEDDALAELMREVEAALEADALIVSWREREGMQPVLIFVDGIAPEKQAAELALIEHSRPWTGPPSGEWQKHLGQGRDGELTTNVACAEGVVTITGRFNRLGAATGLRARDATARILPVLRPFIFLWIAQRALLSRVRGLTAAVNKSDVGILLVDRYAQLLFANAAAEALIAEGDSLRRQGKSLSGSRLADTLKLQATIEHVIAARAAGSSEKVPPVVALTRTGRRPLLASVIASDCEAGERDGDSAAIIYLCDPDQDLTGLVEPTCKLYGLSPVETRLTCLLTRGISLADAAQTMRVREQTARSYLKQIFLKTETRRQAELVWLMLKSSVRTKSTRLAA